MKKRIISLLLTVAMVVSLCTVLVSSASADADVTTVTLAKGDTVLALCQKMGVDFYTYKNLIMNLNGFASESRFYGLAVGDQIKLPVSNAAAADLASGKSTAAASASGSTASATATTLSASAAGTVAAGNVSALPSGDYVSYYLVSYTIQPNETIGGIYSNWGLSYKTYDNQIKKLNNITSYNNIAANTTLLLPTTNPALAASAYYTVMAHVMKSGDTAYDIVCSKYNLNYGANQSMLVALNNVNDLSNIGVGKTLYIPVAGVVTASSVMSTSTSSVTTTASVSNGASYNLVSQTPVNGSFDLQVNGMSVSSAQAGKIVNVVATPNVGYTVDSIRVVKVGDANTYVGVSGTSFTMPSYSVIVNVTFKTAKYYDIKIASSENGSATAMVNGAKVNGAYVGSTVSVKTTPEAGFMLKNVRVTYNNGRDSVAVYNNVFTMPDTEVEVSATFEKDPTYDPSKGYAIYSEVQYGTLETYVGNTKVSNAKAGERVSMVLTPNANYTVQKITVYYDNFNKTAEVDRNSFTMPAAPVTIVPTIRPSSSAVFDITKVDNTNGTFKILVDGTSVSSAKVGAKVTVKGTPKAAAYNYIVSVKETGGNRAVDVVTNEDGTSSFVMPEFPVSVSVRFYLYHKIYLDASNGVNGSFAVYAGSNQVSTCASGIQLKVTVWGIKSGYTASNVILTYADGSSYTLDGAYFIMPDCDVRVKVNFSAVQTIRAHSITVNNAYGQFGNTYSVQGKTLNGNKAATVDVTAGIGSNVVINTAPAFGYEVDQITYTYTDKNEIEHKDVQVTRNPVTNKYQFQMPQIKAGTKLDLYVSFRPISTYAVTCNYIEGYTYPDDNASHKKGTFNVTTMSNSAFVDHAPAGTKVQIHCYPASGYKDDKANVKVINLNTKLEVEINKNDYTFIMPNAPVDVIVPFVRTAHYIRLERANEGTDGNPKGMLSVIVNGIEYTDNQLIYLSTDETDNNVRVTFEPGTLVTVVNKSRNGYLLNSEQPIIVSRVTDSGLVAYNTIDGDHFSFDMPNSDVIIRAQYVDEMVSVNAVPSEHGTYSVPKQVAWNGSFDVTNIYPEDGYELEKILVTYAGHDGTQHTREVLNSTKVDLSGEQGMLRSDINIQVFFRPAVNPLTIHYIFDDTPDTNSNYKVNLLVDGFDVQGIERGYFGEATGAYDDHLYKKAGDEIDADLTGYGIPTGKTVVITRNETKPDENFRIVNIWVKYKNTSGEEVAIKPDFSNNQYYFRMPYIGSGLAKDVTLSIEYAKFTSDTFTLSAYKAAGDGEVASWQFYVDGNPTNHALVSAEKIKLEVIVPPECEITDPAVVIRYTDCDGIAHPTDAELAANALVLSNDGSTADGSQKWSCEFDIKENTTYPYISSMPLNAAVTAEYKVEKKAYEVPAEGTEGKTDLSYYAEGEAVSSNPLAIKWGKLVTLTATPKNEDELVENIGVFYTVNEVDYPVEVSEVGGKYQFVMPKAEIKVTAEMKKVNSVVTVSNTGNGVITEKKIIVINPDGTFTEQIFTDKVALPEGTRFKLAIKAPGCTVGEPTVTDETGATLEADPNGVYTMPAVSVAAQYEINRTLKNLLIQCAADSPVVNNEDIDWAVWTAEGAPRGGKEVTTLGYGDILVIKGMESEDYLIKAINVNYLDINGNPGQASVELNFDGTGSARIQILSELGDPTDGIVVSITFIDNRAVPYTVTGTVGGAPQTKVGEPAEELGEQDIRVTFAQSGGRKYQLDALKGTTVTVYVDLRYYYGLSRDDITISYVNYEDGQTVIVPVNEKKLAVSELSVNKTYRTYACTFTMPKGDVTVNVPAVTALTERSTYSIKKGGEVSFKAYNGNGEISSDNPAELDEEITLVYEDRSALEVQPQDAIVTIEYTTELTKTFRYELEANAVSFNLKNEIEKNVGSGNAHIPMGGFMTVSIRYVNKEA